LDILDRATALARSDRISYRVMARKSVMAAGNDIQKIRESLQKDLPQALNKQFHFSKSLLTLLPEVPTLSSSLTL
jgi:hypothetical protein